MHRRVSTDSFDSSGVGTVDGSEDAVEVMLDPVASEEAMASKSGVFCCCCCCKERCEKIQAKYGGLSQG
jgi:hypothetical protein